MVDAQVWVEARLKGSSVTIGQTLPVATGSKVTVVDNTGYKIIVAVLGGQPAFKARLLIWRNGVQEHDSTLTVNPGGTAPFVIPWKNSFFEDKIKIRIAISDFAKEWLFSIYDHSKPMNNLPPPPGGAPNEQCDVFCQISKTLTDFSTNVQKTAGEAGVNLAGGFGIGAPIALVAGGIVLLLLFTRR